MKYTNPIIKGFHPDPSICRVGEDYYLVTSSFEYFPGIPVFHSRDLIHWNQIGNCITDLTSLPMERVSDSGGIWAPTIRYERGRFFVTSTLEGFGNFIVHATDPAAAWSKPVLVSVGGIDPSLFFEDGRAYYCTNESLHSGIEEITMCEVDVDTGALLSGQKTLWRGIGGGFLEGPHIYHIGEYYYLLAAEGGTNFNHMITVARSNALWGPYESCPENPLLTNAHDTSKEVQCAGHGDLFQDHQGNWWIVHLATRLSRRTMTHLGRETFLTPVCWENGWPVVGNQKKAALECEGPLWIPDKSEKKNFENRFERNCENTFENNCKNSDEKSVAKKVPIWQADFDKTDWEAEWIFLRKPDPSHYLRKDGILRLYPSTVSLSDKSGSIAFAAVRQPDFDCQVDTCFTFDAMQIGDEAGLVLRLSSDFHYCFCKYKNEQGTFLCVKRKMDDICYTDRQIPIENSALCLRIIACKEHYRFSYKTENGNYQDFAKASTRFLSCEVAGKCFTGTVIGLYAASACTTDSVMKVESFSIADFDA